MAGFLGALEYVLEEGPRKDWFDDNAIIALAIVSGASAVVFFARVLTTPEPIVDLRAFANRNFALGSLFSFVLGIGLYGLTYLYPVYLAQVRGYNALMIGDTMFISGMAMFISAPIVGRLVGKVDPRYVLMTGFLFFAFGTWQMTWITRDWDFWELLLPQIFRGVGLMFAIVPVTNTALGTLPSERMKNASGLFNLTRNLGGAIGLAAINTVLNDRMDLHLARLHEAVTLQPRRRGRDPGANMTATVLKASAAMRLDDGAQADEPCWCTSRRRVMAFADVFLMLTVVYVLLAAAGIVMKRPVPVGAGAGGH